MMRRGALDAVAKFFRTNEPSSPILLIERAKRLRGQGFFFEVLEELAPERSGSAARNKVCEGVETNRG